MRTWAHSSCTSANELLPEQGDSFVVPQHFGEGYLGKKFDEDCLGQPKSPKGVGHIFCAIVSPDRMPAPQTDCSHMHESFESSETPHPFDASSKCKSYENIT